MIFIRSKDEIASIRQAGKILASTLSKLRRCAKAGIQTKELDLIARDEILKHNGYPAFKGYKGFPGNICTSINEVVVHGIPSGRKLRNGDLLSIDVGVKFKGYYADAAVTLPIGNVTDSAKRLMTVTHDALDNGISAARSGNRLSDISANIQKHVEGNGFSIVRVFVGHGIGTHIHEEPEIPNFGRAGTGPKLEPGMVLAIEPMVNVGTYNVDILEDGWTAVTADGKLSAHFEHTIAVTDGEPQILTRP